MLNSLTYGDCSVNENTVDQLRTNDLVFRSDFSKAQYDDLPRLVFDEDSIDAAYTSLVQDMPLAVFIDMTDIFGYITVNNNHGLDKDDILTLISLVADGIGDESSLHGEIWNHYADDLSTTLATKLGVDEGDVIQSDAFNKAMEDLFTIASIIASYMVNSNMPLIDRICAYTYHQEKNGIVAFKLRSLGEIHHEFG